MKKNLYNNTVLFNTIEKSLKDEGLIPDILDYSQASNKTESLKGWSLEVVSVLSYGSNEGIYLNIVARGVINETYKEVLLGVFKTLGTSNLDMRRMAILGADFVSECTKFINEHIDKF